MRLLLVSEGKHESAGALQAIITRIAGFEIEFVHHPANDANIQASHGRHGVGSRLSKRVKAFARLAIQQDCSGLIYLIDQDHQPERRRALDDAQSDSDPVVAQAIGIAVETFDAWILADERAISQALGCPIDRQPDPETLRDAKGLCEKLRNESGQSTPLREMYAKVCQHAEIATLRQRCPNGFAPFSDRLLNLFQALR